MNTTSAILYILLSRQKNSPLLPTTAKAKCTA